MREHASKDGKQQGEQQRSSSRLNIFPPLPVGPGLTDGPTYKPLRTGPGLLRSQPPAAPRPKPAPQAFSVLQSTPTLMRTPAGALAVNDPNDAFEEEADRVADQVMRMTDPAKLQRTCSCTAEDRRLQRTCASCKEKEEEEGSDKIQPQVQRSGSGTGPATAPPIVHEVLRSPGQPLDASTRNFMEPRFRQSFSNVRVHLNAQAAESAHAVDALAYTVGSDIVFGSGQYAPQTDPGARLLAHELTHTIQQSRSASAVDGQALIQRQAAVDNATSRKPTVHRNTTQKGLLIPWKGTTEASIFSFLADFMPAPLAHEITSEVLARSRFEIEGKSVSRATFDKRPGDFLLGERLTRFLVQRTGLRVDDPDWLKLSPLDRRLLADFARARPDLAQSDKIRFDHLTTEVKQRMALQLADTTILGASAKAAKDAFTNPRFLTVLVGVTALYYILWAIPHPVAKFAAATLTAYLLTQFTWHDLYGFAKAWGAFYDDCARAKTGDDLKKAGNRFLAEAGPRVFDIMLAIVLWRVGKRVGRARGKSSGTGKAGAEGGTTGAEPGRVEPEKVEPEKVEPVEPEKAKPGEPEKTEPIEPKKAEPAQPEKVEPEKVEQSQQGDTKPSEVVEPEARTQTDAELKNNLDPDPRSGETAEAARLRSKQAAEELGRRSKLPICFVAGTPVQTPEGPMTIESLEPGQFVLARSEAQEIQSYRVLDCMRGQTLDVYHVEVAGTQTLTTTRNHPFFVVGKGWITARKLVSGDDLVTLDGSHLPITAIVHERLREPVATFNIHVETASTYFVGSSSAVWVHNADPNDPIFRTKLFWGFGSKGPRVRVPDPQDPTRLGDIDGASAWQTESFEEVQRFLGVRKLDGATGNHGSVSEAELTAKGLIAVETPGDDADLVAAGLKHFSIRPKTNPKPENPLTVNERTEMNKLLDSLATLKAKAKDVFC